MKKPPEEVQERDLWMFMLGMAAASKENAAEVGKVLRSSDAPCGGFATLFEAICCGGKRGATFRSCYGLKPGVPILPAVLERLLGSVQKRLIAKAAAAMQFGAPGGTVAEFTDLLRKHLAAIEERAPPK